MGLRGLFASTFAIALGATLYWGIALQGELAFPSTPGAPTPFLHYVEVAASAAGLVLMAAGALWFGVSSTFVVLSRHARTRSTVVAARDEGASHAFTP